MDSAFFLTVVAAAIGFFALFGAPFFMVYRKFRSHHENKDLASSSSLPSSSLTTTSCKWTHDVFPSFRGEDVRKNFLSHIQKEFRRKGITPFIDNEIKRGESIGPELIQAIRSSKVAVVLLSRNYASSKWCLDELVEIMKCKEESGQMVFAIFYEVDPSEVKKLNGEFGAVFKKTCAGKTKEEVERWRQALEKVATIAGYDSRTWDNEALMIEKIVTEISKRLISSTPSRYMEGLIGMGAHMENMKQLLCLGSDDEIRKVGIWGPPGIGKTTIARVIYDQISSGFQLSVFMTFKPSYARPTYCNDHDEKLHLEQQFLSKLLDQEDIKIQHLGATQNFLMHKKVLVIFDGVERLVQLDVMPKAQCLGHGSRIIITTQNQKILKAFEIKHIYQVDFPPDDEALQIFCMSAFGQNSPKDGFKKLAEQVTVLADGLPLGLKVMGSHFRGILSKQEWIAELPRLKVCLDGEIGSILKFSYDALEEEDKDLFLYIACFFVDGEYLDNDIFEDVLRHRFSNVSQGLNVLVQRSLLASEEYYWMHSLLVDLGREIVRNRSIDEPGKRQFLVDAKDICEVLTDNTGSRSVIGINLNLSEMEDELHISESAFEEMSNLQFLSFNAYDIEHRYAKEMSNLQFLICNIHEQLHLPQGLKYLPPKLRILHWDHYPLMCLPCNFNPKLLVKIEMMDSKLEKLWEGNKSLRNLKWMDLRSSRNLKELPDLSTATNLKMMNLVYCSSLMELPSSIENLTNLKELNLEGCSKLVELPSSVGNLTKLRALNLSDCPELVELPSSVGNLTNLKELNLRGCSKLVELPSSVGNLTKLRALNLSDCPELVELPSSVENLTNLKELNLEGCSKLVELPSSVGNLTKLRALNLSDCPELVELPSSVGNLTNLKELILRGCSSLLKLPSSIGNLTNLRWLDLQGCSSLLKLPSSIGNLTNLRGLDLQGCSSLLKLPSSIGNLTNLRGLHLQGCSSLLKLPTSIGNLTNLRKLNLRGCSKLVELPSSVGNLTNLWDCLSLNDCSSLVKLPPSFGNLTNIQTLILRGCAKLEVLPININLASLVELDVTGCSQLTIFPEVSTEIRRLSLCGTLIKEVPLWIKSCSKLEEFSITYSKNLEEFPHVLDIITELQLNDKEMEQIPPWVNRMSRLKRLELNKCRKLVSLPQLPGSLKYLEAENCDSLERLDCSFPNPDIIITFINCWKLNEEARDIIIRASSSSFCATILPGREVPVFFTHRATTVKANLGGTSLRFRSCFSLVPKAETEARDEESIVVYCILYEEKQSGLYTILSRKDYWLRPLLTEHLYTFHLKADKWNPASFPFENSLDVESSEFFFEFKLITDKWEIAECGIRQLLEDEN